MFRQQLTGIRISKAVGQLCKEGVGNLYRGLLPPLLMKTTSMAIMFGTYHQYKHVRMVLYLDTFPNNCCFINNLNLKLICFSF